MTESLATFLPAVIWKRGNILNEILDIGKNISRQYFESAKFILLTVYGKIKIDKLKKDPFSFEVDYRGNFSNPRIYWLGK